MLMDYFDNYATNHAPYKGGPWCYEDGLVYRGCERLFYATGDERWIDHVKRMIAPQILAGPSMLGYKLDDYNIDNIMPGRALLFLYRETKDQTYLDAAGLLARQLETHPRTKSNVYWHKKRYPWQIWLDGLYMGTPVQIEYGLATGNYALVADALQQLKTAMDLTFVADTKLYAHAFDEARQQPWADPSTGLTRAHWARAIGWLAMALVEIAEQVGPERFLPFRQRVEDLCTEIVRWRQPDGLWLQVMDQPNLPGNWGETSASAMFCCALLQAKKLGFWNGPAQQYYDEMVQSSVIKTPRGQEMVQMCHVAGLGQYEGRFRDGSAAYYISENIVSDDPKGVGPLMMAAAATYAGQ